MYKRICAVILSLLFIVGLSAEVGRVFANGAASVSIQFTGDEAKRAGFAQSEITVTPGAAGAKAGYYVVYYTDGQQVLAGYDEATAIKITGGTAKGGITDGHLLPKGAKGIAVFESNTHYLTKTPNIKEAIATAEIPAAKQTPDFGAVEFSFGAISDTHMNYEQYDRGAYEKLRNSMNFFAKEQMDIVVITGDMTGDRGDGPSLEEQYEKHKEILKGSDFPQNKVYEGIGNHGNTPADAALMTQYLGGKDENHPFKNSPYYHVLFKGKNGARDNLFIFMAQEIEASSESSSRDNFSKRQIDWLEDLLERYGETDANIFLIIHSPFLQHGAGDIENGTYTNCITLNPKYEQTMRLQTLLEIYKDSIVMSGHSHISFYENANYSDLGNDFARTVHIGSNCQPCGYGGTASHIRSFDGRRNVTPTYGSEGYTVEVYKDYIIYTGYNFSTGQRIPAACLILPVEGYGEAEGEDLTEVPGQIDPVTPDAPAGQQPEKAPATDQPAGPADSEQQGTENSQPNQNGDLTQAPQNGQVLIDGIEGPEDGGIHHSSWIWIGVLGALLFVAPGIILLIILCKKK